MQSGGTVDDGQGGRQLRGCRPVAMDIIISAAVLTGIQVSHLAEYIHLHDTCYAAYACQHVPCSTMAYFCGREVRIM